MQRHLMTAFVSLCATLLVSEGAFAATFFVATNGNDNAAGTSAAPWATLQTAVNRIAPGDTIMVRSGTYAGFRATTSGTQTAPKTLMAVTGATVIVNRPGPNNAHNSDVEIETFVGNPPRVTDWRVIGIEMRNAPRYGFDARNTQRVQVERCRAQNNTLSGFFTAFSDDFSITNSVTNNNGEHGIYLSNSGMRPSVVRNDARDNQGSGIQLNADLSQGAPGMIRFFLIDSNTVSGNGAQGGAALNFDGASDGLIVNNLLFNNHASGIALFAIDGAEGSSRNLVVNNTVVMAANARNVVTIPASPAGRPNPTGNVLINNIFWSPDRPAISLYTANPAGFQSNFNAFNLNPRFSINNGATTISLAQWRALAPTLHDQSSVTATTANLFVNPGANNFHLRTTPQPVSPAINAGTNRTGVPNDDIEGTPRPQRGPLWDIGAFEARP